jgi:hypothetical protein
LPDDGVEPTLVSVGGSVTRGVPVAPSTAPADCAGLGEFTAVDARTDPSGDGGIDGLGATEGSVLAGVDGLGATEGSVLAGVDGLGATEGSVLAGVEALGGGADALGGTGSVRS